MKVLITVPDFNLPGGVTNIFRSIKWEDTDQVEYFYNTTNLTYKKLWFIPIMVLRFVYHAKKVELVHLNPSFNAKSIIRDGLLILLTKLLNKKILVFFHGWNDRFEQVLFNNNFYKKLFKIVFNLVDGYCLLGMLFHEKLIKLGVSGKNVFYLPTVADDSYISLIPDNKNEVPKNVISLLYLSRFDHQKGMDIALLAFKKIQELQSLFELKLVMAGDGPYLKASKQLVIENNINNVHFQGFVDGKEKHQSLVEADILFFPTCYGEGLPCVIMEAMLYGLVIVTRPVGGIPYWVKHNENGWLSDSTDPEVFAKGILSLLDHPDLLNTMGKTNQRIAKDNFTPKKVKLRLLDIYNYLLYVNNNIHK